MTLTGTKTSDGDTETLVGFRGEAVCPGQEPVCRQLHDQYSGDRSLSVGVPDELVGTSSGGGSASDSSGNDSGNDSGNGSSGSPSDSSDTSDASGSPTSS